MNFNEFNRLLIDEFRVEKLSDIAHELNVTPQVVNNWKIEIKCHTNMY